ncbi:MAG TPA: SRPBCC family protein [Thermoplasmata archaeon]|jgi:carbon monoxide dehydrogenase subunit G
MRLERGVTIAASPETVWSLVADFDRELEFWRGTKAVLSMRRDGNVIEREVRIAFRGRVQRERVILAPPSRIVHEILSGPMRGTKTVTVRPSGAGTILTAAWDVTLVGLLKLGSRVTAKHVAEGTEHALRRIKDAAEGGAPSA